MDDLQAFLDIWLPLTQNGTYRAFGWWEDGFGNKNHIYFLPVSTEQQDRHDITFLVLSKGELFVYLSTFSHKSTKLDYAEPINALWLDLDTCYPSEYPPDLLWETSKGHYQGLWILKEEVNVEQRRNQNRALYHYFAPFGADASYEENRRLRIPGSYNHKPDRDNFYIHIINNNTTLGGWTLDSLPSPTGEHATAQGGTPVAIPPSLELLSLLPDPLRATLREPVPVGQRSDALVEVLRSLAAVPGLTPEQIYQIAYATPFNKFKNRPDQLWKEVNKAYQKVEPAPPGFTIIFPTTEPTTPPGPQPSTQDPLAGWHTRDELPNDYSLKWQVNPFLPQRSVLLVAGLPGVRKSWLVTDLVVCVSQGCPFLGAPILDPGPVMYYAPDDEQERLSERINLIEQAHGCTKPTEMLWRQSGIHFADKDWAVKLQLAMEAYRPKLVVFDGLYLMGYRMEDYGASLPQYLVPLKEMCAYFNCSFIIVHHSAGSRSTGQDPRMSGMGTTLLAAFFTMAWNLENAGFEENWQRVNWNIGGKATPGRPRFKLRFGSDLTKYDPGIEVGSWDKDETVESPGPTTNAQIEF